MLGRAPKAGAECREETVVMTEIPPVAGPLLRETPLPGVALLRFGNAPHGCFDEGSEAAFESALDAIDAEPATRLVVLAGGVPGVFVRHYDVGVLESRGRALAARGLRFDVSRPVPEAPIHRCLRRIGDSARIFIAAIDGVAMGGGCEIALACDLRVAADGDYPIGLPEVNIGLLPGAGGTQRLARLVGEAKALELILLGRTLSPREAARLGIVNECVDGPALPRALQIAARLAGQPARALAHVKRLVRQAFEGGDAGALATALAQERTRFCDLLVSDEAIERMHAMNQGRRTIRD
jgi:enoyl-CoA hydratase